MNKTLTAGCTLGCGLLAFVQGSSLPEIPVRMIVTVGHYSGGSPPLLMKSDLSVRQLSEPLQITSLTPLSGDHGPLELFVLVDSCSSCEAGSQFQNLRNFIASQPATTAIGVAYFGDGRLKVLAKPSADHQRAVEALNTPGGSNPANPYVALEELISAWPDHSVRRAILMVSRGIDPTATEALINSSADAAIAAAQRAGVNVFAVYHPRNDYASVGHVRIYLGQVQLAHIASETGGEAYFVGSGPLPSLAPILGDIREHLGNQYLLEFLAHPKDEFGSLEDVTIETTLPNVQLMVPYKAWVTGTGL